MLHAPRYLAVGSILAIAVATASAQQAAPSNSDANRATLSNQGQPVLTLAQNEPAHDDNMRRDSGETPPPPSKPLTLERSARNDQHPYGEVSDFFNVREANPQVACGGWEVELFGGWFTQSHDDDDEIWAMETIKYGISDDMFVQVGVAQPDFGDGGDSHAGEIFLTVFNRFLREESARPAIAGYARMRVPTGDGSSGVDGEGHVIVTKSINDCFRIHGEAFIKTANGEYNREDDRRHFQWGGGGGVDYKLSERSLLVGNFIHRTNDREHAHNENIAEAGAVFQVSDNMHLKVAADVGLDGSSDTPNFGGKVQWTIDWH